MSQSNAFPSLTIKDKINWPFILGDMVLKFHEAIVKVEGEQSEQEVREAVLALNASIPTSWKESDPSYRTEASKAVIKRKIDVRKEWCGHKVGKPKYEREEIIDPYRLFNCIVDLLDRRGLISREEKIEKVDGVYGTSESDSEF